MSKYGVLGKDISYSLSPFIYDKFFTEDYEIINKEEFELQSFFKSRDFKGINVTTPYKEKCIKYLDEVSPLAKVTGSVNTILNDNGKLIGYNTDYFGFQRAVNYYGLKFAGETVLILGTGGAAKTVYEFVKNSGGVPFLVGRKSKINYRNVYKHFKNSAKIIVNATPVGGKFSGCPIKIKKFTNVKKVFDLIYSPLKTELILDAEKMGIPCFNGLYMLISQGLKSMEFFGLKEKINEEKAYEFLINSVQNIVLVGMAGAGKSCIAKGLSEILNKPFIDTDEEIEKKEKKSASEIIETFGEKYFRKKEREVIKEISSFKGYIISTGGGVVQNKDNVLDLKKNGKIVYVKRNVELLSKDNRPLYKKYGVDKIFLRRKKIYEGISDIEVENDGEISDTINKLAEMLR